MSSSSVRSVVSFMTEEPLLAKTGPTARQLTLIGIGTLLLTSVGAAIFCLLEHHPARQERHRYESQLSSLLAEGNFTTSQYAAVQQIIRLHGHHACRTHMVKSDPWSFWSSFYFTTALISTVGYGDLAPETGMGKAAAVIISFVGIPLFLSFAMPLSQKLVDELTRRVRQLYITRAVERAWEAARRAIPPTEELGESRDAVRLTRGTGGAGLSRRDIWKVELATLLLLLLMMLFGVCFVATTLEQLQHWPLGDAFVFIWYTLTTIGLGDHTVELRHPITGSAVLVLLILVGAAAARALILFMQRLACIIEQRLYEGPLASCARWKPPNGSDSFPLSAVLEPLANANNGMELEHPGAEPPEMMVTAFNRSGRRAPSAVEPWSNQT